jgi:hypothetical protein
MKAQRAARVSASLGNLGLSLIHGGQNRSRTVIKGLTFDGEL